MKKGIYVLIISLCKNIEIEVGALGNINFKRGLYAYVGSAQNNLEKRLNRHLNKFKKKFWHIDYFLADEHAKIVKVFYKSAEKPWECHIAKIVCDRGIPIKGFGSSDCHCKSHLFKIEDYQFLREFMFEK
ncbi:MAG: GIY-YIG nuclease family protein [Candidatus Bathyarchaeia archaeon]